MASGYHSSSASSFTSHCFDLHIVIVADSIVTMMVIKSIYILLCRSF